MSYLLGEQPSELDRLQLQSRVWEPAGARLLAEIGDGTGLRAVDVGCGCFGWLRLLSTWVGPTGTCVGTDVDPRMLQTAADLVAGEQFGNVELVQDDLFNSQLPPASFDLVHARFQLAPLGRVDEQLAAFQRLLRPGGILVLEEPDSASWRYEPEAPAAMRLKGLITDAFRASGGDFDAGRNCYEVLRNAGLGPHLRAEVVALPPGHPYLRLPVQFATSLRPKLLVVADDASLDETITDADRELAQPNRWGMTFTLVQAWALVD